MTILLSICIPTYNRAKYLDISLQRITEDVDFINRDDIEIIISDNASPDNTKEICEKYIQKFPDKIRYNRNETNIGNKNFPLVLNMAKGTFAKLHNDTAYFKKGGLKKMLDVIQDNQDLNAIYFSNGHIIKLKTPVMTNNASELFKVGTHWLTWISSMCYKTETFNKLENPMRFADLKLAQFDMLLRIVGNTKCLIDNEVLMHVQYVPNKAKYSCAEVFGKNYFYIIQTLIKENVLSKEVFNEDILKEELDYITPAHFNFLNNQTKPFAKGYFKNIYKFYWNKPYFYTNYFKHLCYKIFFIPFRLSDYIPVFSKSIKDFYYKILWKRQNKNNNITLKNYSDYKFVTAGENSTGEIDLEYYGSHPSEILHIGNNVKIGKNVKFILSIAPEGEKPKDENFDEGKNREIVIPDNTIIPDNKIVRTI